MSNELTSKIAELRSKVISGTATEAELREGLRLLRADRVGASERRATAKAKAAPVDGAALLEKLKAMTGLPKPA